MLFSADDEAVDWRAEGLRDRLRAAGELDEEAALADLCDLEALGGEPLGDGVDVGCGDAEAFTKLLGSEPLVIGGRVDVPLVFDETREGCLLFGAALEDHQHALQLQVCGRCTLIEIAAGEWMDIARQRSALCVVDGLRDPARGGVLLGGKGQADTER